MICVKLSYSLVCMRTSSFFFFKQKTAYEMRISDWSSDVCSSDLAVIIALGGGSTEDFDLTVVQPEPPVDGGDLRFDRAFVGQEDARRAAFNDGGCNGRGLDVGEALGSEDDAGVLLPQSLQPFLELLGEGRTVQHQPALVDDDEGRRSVEPAFDPVEQIGEHGGRGAGAGQPFGLERLDIGVAQMLGFRIEQLAVRSADAIGTKRLL